MYLKLFKCFYQNVLVVWCYIGRLSDSRILIHVNIEKWPSAIKQCWHVVDVLMRFLWLRLMKYVLILSGKRDVINQVSGVVSVSLMDSEDDQNVIRSDRISRAELSVISQTVTETRRHSEFYHLTVVSLFSCWFLATWAASLNRRHVQSEKEKTSVLYWS